LILTASYDFFGTLLQKNSSDDNVNDAEAKRNKLVRLIRNLGILNGNLTVKGHIIEDHAIGWMQTCRAWELPLRLIIEQSVELNHQTGKRLDKQGKRFAVAKTMANTMCKRKALETNNLVRKWIKFVHKKTVKGEYKKKDCTLDAALVAALVDINPYQQQPTAGGATATADTPLQKLVAVTAPVVCAKATAAITLVVALEAIAPQQRQPTIAGITAAIDLNAAAIDPAPRVRSKTGMAPGTGTSTSGPRRHAITSQTDLKTVRVEGGSIHVRLVPGFKKGKHDN
jgi:hypothetical protein